MAEIDTSSYPKPATAAPQKSLLDQVQQYGAIEQQGINIDRGKLELAIKNQDNLLQTLNALPKDATPEEYRKWGQSAVKSKLVNPKQYAEFVTNMPPATGDPVKDAQAMIRYRDIVERRAMGITEAMKWKYGEMTSVDTGQTVTPAMRDPRSGAIAPAGAPIQRQLPVEAPVVTPEGPRSLGPQAPVLPEGAAPVPGGLPGQYKLPVGPITDPRIQGESKNFGGNVIGAQVEDAPIRTAQNQYKAAGPTTGQTPMFEEGKKMLVGDQQEASARLMRVKPAQQALELMQKPGMLSGPLSEQFTQGVAALKTFGLIPAEMNDPTAIRQEVAKKLADYVAKSPIASRSDASQALAEASSPNPKSQTLPALIKLTKDAIVLDRIQSAMPNAFKDKDLSTYGKFKAAFPNTVDERAFGLDMEKDRGQQVVVEMTKKLQSKDKKDRNDAQKFFRSLEIADQQGFYQ